MSISEDKNIKCAIPSKGRLNEPAINLLKKAGYVFRTTGRKLYATCTNAAITFILVRADDIPLLVASGAVDAGITGSDSIVEHNADVVRIMDLGFGRCRLCIAVKEHFEGTDLSAFSGKNIATSFPRLTSEFFSAKGIFVNCMDMKGSVEIMVDLNIADAVVDIVETGDSLRDNKLKVFTEIGSYEAVFIANKAVSGTPEILHIKRRLEGIIIAERYSLLEYNIPSERFKEAERITPGFSSPTVAKLDRENWLSVKAMVEKSTVISVMDKLESLGATAIIETAVINCRL